MTDLYKPMSDDAHRGSEHTPGNPDPASSRETGRALLAGLLGGIASAAGYLIYTRLPDEHKEKLREQGRALLESRINEARSRFNL